MTTASPDVIAAYFQTHFRDANYSFEHGVYSFSKCDRSPLAKAVARWLNEGRYPHYTADNVPLPCVLIYIDTDDATSTGTPYQLWIEWPSW
jgi:hypothetical protein